ncbi:hypothetical protein AAE02nite_08830 [Adhaeribacter aerolatus]|uniref:Uncharacterized protein n=1 Tax=Adhaeribacter aerolatus TaxID=670289 RepID=A0A512AU17_9BACT|nr:hypothetical protein [Adhaeribacter aerolatus]GEO03219.1 hypothetical protein AAE02nite_08830 [Adhaeribacter aerolatus]
MENLDTYNNIISCTNKKVRAMEPVLINSFKNSGQVVTYPETEAGIVFKAIGALELTLPPIIAALASNWIKVRKV